VHITWYSGRDDPAGADQGLALIQADHAQHGLNAPFILLHQSFWPYGEAWEAGAYVDLAGGQEAPMALLDRDRDWRRFLAALWLLMHQKITLTRPEPVSRAQRKQAERAKVPAHPVNIVTLRRATPPPEASERTVEHHQVDWSCRWIVGAAKGGFWNTYHTKDGPEPRWITPFMKGPPDKPLKFSQTVYKLVR
jgi:hypothetical protein